MSNKPLLTPNLTGEDKKRIDAIFEQIEQNLGFIPDGLRLYSISPAILESFLGVIGHFMGHTTFRQELLAMIRYLTSSKAQCKFCITFNEGILIQTGMDLDAIRATQDNVDAAPLKTNELALLKLALQANDDPNSVKKQNIEDMKAQGWNERDIFEAVFLAANNKAFTTMLKTFKVEEQGSFT